MSILDDNQIIEQKIELDSIRNEQEAFNKIKKKMEENYYLYIIQQNSNTMPIKSYLVYKKKKNEYLELYHKNKVLYYLKVKYKILKKIIKAELTTSNILCYIGTSFVYFITLKNIINVEKVFEIFKKYSEKFLKLFTNNNN